MRTDPPCDLSVSPGGKKERVRALFLPAVVLVLAAVVLVLLRSEFQTGDSLAYARSVRSGTNLFHPHHLLFNPIIRGVWLGLRAVFPAIDPIAAGQVHNILWALVTLASFFTVIRRTTGSAGAAAVFTLALFATIGFWQYATFVEIYVPSMGCLSVIIALLGAPRPGPPGPAVQMAVAGLLSLAVLYNQMAVLFVPALAVLLTPRFRFREVRRTAGLLAAAGGIVLAAYVAAFLATAHPKTPAGFVLWCLSYAFNPDPTWGAFSNFSPVGLSKLFLSFARDVLFIPRTILAPAAVLSGLVCGALTFAVLRSIFRRRLDRRTRIAMFLWIFITALFLWWFCPSAYELSISLLLPVLWLLARLSADVWESGSAGWAARRLVLAGGASVGAVVFFINLSTAVLPAHVSRGVDFSRAERIQRTIPAGAAVFADFCLAENLRYYHERPDVVIDVDILFSFYRSMALEPGMIPDPEKPRVVSVEFLSPETKPGGMFGGEARPGEWLALLEWVCGIVVRDGRAVAARTPLPIEGLPGYLLLSGESRPVDGLAEVFRRLDEAATVAVPGFGGFFSAWLARHPEGVL